MKRNRNIAIIVIGVFLINYISGYPFTYPIIDYRVNTLDLDPLITTLPEEDVLNIYKILLEEECNHYYLNPIAQPLGTFDKYLPRETTDKPNSLPKNLINYLGCDIKFGRYEDFGKFDIIIWFFTTHRDYVQVSVPKILDNGTVYIEKRNDKVYGIGLSPYSSGWANYYHLIKTNTGEWSIVSSRTMKMYN